MLRDRYRCFLAGRPVETGTELLVSNKYTGAPVTRVARADRALVTEAISRSAAAVGRSVAAQVALSDPGPRSDRGGAPQRRAVRVTGCRAPRAGDVERIAASPRAGRRRTRRHPPMGVVGLRRSPAGRHDAARRCRVSPAGRRAGCGPRTGDRSSRAPGVSGDQSRGLVPPATPRLRISLLRAGDSCRNRRAARHARCVRAEEAVAFSPGNQPGPLSGLAGRAGAAFDPGHNRLGCSGVGPAAARFL